MTMNRLLRRPPLPDSFPHRYPGDQDLVDGVGHFALLRKPFRRSALAATLERMLKPGLAPCAQATPSVNPVRSRGKILVAEDNAVNQKVAVNLLRRLDFDAEVVANGLLALNAASRGGYDATGQNAIVRPRKCIRDRTYAHIESNSSVAAVVTPAKTKEFRTSRRNGSCCQTPM